MNYTSTTRFLYILTLFFILGSCKLGRFVVYNFADIKDYKKFSSRELEAPESSFHFETSVRKVHPDTLQYGTTNLYFDQVLAANNTVAFLIIKDDSIHYENYFHNYEEESIIPSFSMAKSITSILIGCAIDEGLIKSVTEPITNYIPELSEKGFDKVTIKHVIQMTSALDFNESYYNPFGHAASFYYGRNLHKEISKLELKGEPGEKTEYVSGNTQLLGLILERALKDRTITSYFQEKLWTPLEMEYDASWSIDKKKDGLEKTFCCINARARDFAKIGRLYLNKGNWNGKQIVSASWVEESTKLDTTEGSVHEYQYQWWIPSQEGDFMAEGILGQYIYVNPNTNVIIVRMGKNHGHINWNDFLIGIAKYMEKKA